MDKQQRLTCSILLPAALPQMEQSFKLQQSTGLASQGESDEVKRIFLEGNPYLLALTMAVSMLHSVFDFLAFKNDIGFWKENKSMEGLSARSIVINAFCQLVIFLYLLDNETSMVVLLSAGVTLKGPLPVPASCQTAASTAVAPVAAPPLHTHMLSSA